ncbi:50S ribosomal protein L23 [Flexilinea flocculi]|jgi:large subunit ribosomal protein L23|uniref:Large ribosomal subunit protein uL23 n=1 Tax=Flexilinea flocculi TaxID=1678840 RepID=A0A0K8PB89_9CHLR|nr:50S ribosomal protein L23 [Flexilinea flocculi]NMB93275.1 50S ribosomal protein L23 [Flexilinea flocculi]GAP39779.1 ribosomal protein L23 [Flexilinea flocculi]
MSTIYDVLRRPMVTEKTNDLAFKLNQYVFEVQVNANRTLVKEAVESIFKVNVVSVNIIKTPGKSKRNTKSRRVTLKKPVMKKAIVTLAAGEKIPFFEGVE